MELRVTAASPPAPEPAPGAGTYVLQAGDSFDTIAEQFGLTGPEGRRLLLQLNPHLAGARPRPGQVVLIPDVGPAPPPATAAPPARGDSVATEWTNGYRRNVSRQNHYNAELESAKARWDALDPLVLKSMLAQESNFAAKATNGYGYAGIAQLGLREARSQGLRTASSRMRNRRLGLPAYVDPRDERLAPAKAIPAAAGLMKQKAATLERGITTKGVRLAGFGTLGRPRGDDYWRFVAAAYNGGEGTVLWALHYAYGGSPPAEVRWDDLVRAPGGDVRRSPLYRAIKRVGMDPRAKFPEISDYASQVLLRARQE